MKKLITVLLVCFIASCVYSQSNTVMIKSVETYGTFMKMKKVLHIINEVGEVETIELEKHNTEGILKNMIIIKKALDKFIEKGYNLFSSTAVSFGENGVYTIEHTYLFLKEENEIEN